MFLVDFARRLGADAAMLGVLAALPFLAQSVQLGTAWVYEHVSADRESITRRTLLVARLLWLVPAGLAFCPASDGARLAAYLAVVGLSALLATAGAHGWTSWMVDLVPGRVRGRYFGFRAAVAAAVAVVAGYGGGLLLDGIEAEREGAGFAAVYVLVAVAGVGAWIAIRFQHHPRPRRSATHPPFAALWKEVWARAEYRRIFGFFAAWNVALGVAVPFWQDYMRTELRMKASMMGLQATLGAVVGVGLAPLWGRLIDRAGFRPVLLLNAACIAVIPFVWLACAPGRTFPVWIDAFVVGIFWTGFNLTALNVPIAAAPVRGGAVFLGVFGAVTGLAMGLACLAGGIVAKAIGPGPHVLFGLPLAAHQVMFVASGCLRILVLPLALRLPDPKARRMVFVFQAMGFAVRHRLNASFQLLTAPWRRR